MKRIAAFFLVFVICISVVSPGAFAISRDTSVEQELALDLKSLALFKGVSDTEFELSRAPTRTEAVVMLIRVLGKEGEAQNGSWTHPFSDVATWANKYVGYAYQKGLTKGVSDTQFGSGNASSNTYLTFVLRALGYSDTNGADFTYENPFTLAKSLNLLPGRVDTGEFLRADVVLVSYSALTAKIKGTDQALCDKLIADGVFTKQQYDTYYDAKTIASANTSARTVLTAEEVYAKCSPAVFYVEVYGKNGSALASGSGFFIDSQGTAITNFHVIEGAYSAKITVSDTEKIYNVAGVYDYNADQDWAVLKIDGTGFSYLKVGDSASVVGGATVYAIGSPLGLQNTITQGLISNVKRTEGSVSYIQTSAAISPGSSGGALINKYGEVIGITSATYVEGQNLNLALPMTYLSGKKTSSVTPLSSIAGTTTTPTEPISIETSSENVEVKAGYSSTIYVRWTGGSDDDNIYWDSSNESVASATWGEWISNEVLALRINGLKLGTATITISVDSQHSCDVRVTVGSDSPNAILKKNLMSKGTYNSQIGGYQLSYTTSTGTYYIVYRPGNQYDLCLMRDSVENGYRTNTIVCLIEGGSAIYNMKMYSPEIVGYDYFSKKTFNTDTTFYPQNYTGDYGYRSTFSNLCAPNVCYTLLGAEVILMKNNIPITINDLGFEALYQEVMIS